MYNNNLKIVDILPVDYLKNQKCLILAGGPSLKKVSQEIIYGWRSVGVNRSYEKFNTDILYCMDLEFYDRIWQLQFGQETFDKFQAFPGAKVFLSMPADIKYKYGVCVVNRIYEETLSYNINNGIFAGGNSGLGAVMLAIALGCKDIYIAGLDLKATDQTHYHTGYIGQEIDKFRSVLFQFQSEFEHWAPRFKEEGIKITQLIAKSVDETSLTCFDKEFINSRYII